MFDAFHFLRPLILLLIPVLIVLVWLWMRIKLASSQWQSILPIHLHQRLVTSKGDGHSRQPFIWLMIAMIIACIGMAGPAWEKLPQPVYQTNSGRVVVMDMSLSMRATDVSPSRLARAKFKAIDLIKEINDGEVGLVAYAGEAFTISPLTEDISNLENLIPSLSPEIMPGSGSNPVAGFTQAKQLLDNAGYQHGHIYWITDGIALEDVAPLRNLINDTQYEVSGLIIGTDDGAPIKLLDGSMLKDSSGAIVIPRVNHDYLEQALAPSNARHTRMTIDDSDIRSMLLTSSRLDQVREGNDEQSTGDAWRDMGAYLALLLLPIAMLMFRRGLLFSIVLIVLLPMHSPKSLAQTPPTSSAGSAVQTNHSITDNLKSLFLNRNQQGQQAFEANDFEGAGELFEDINWQAAAAYKAGDYESAAALYQQGDGIDNIYNRGNALAKMGELQKALEAYNKVLQIAPEHEQAVRNKTIIEDLLKQQENQQEQQGQDDQQSDQNNEQNNEGEQQEQTQDGSQSDQNSEQNAEQSESGEAQEQQNESENQNQQGESENAEQSPTEEENEQSEQPGSDVQQPENSEQEQEQDLQNIQAIDQNELTPEEREQMQRLQTLMNKVPDDPAFLLQRKMLIESQRRREYSPPTTKEQEW